MTSNRAMTDISRAPRYAVALAATLLLPFFAGCDALGLGGSTWTGVVVDATTGAPIAGIHVSLQVGGGGFGAYTIVEEGLTDRGGEFRLHTSRDDTSLYVNNPPYCGSSCPVILDYIGKGPLL